jgi:hypothetical protein
LGRFLSVDSIDSSVRSRPQTLNRYTYGLNNPLKFVDRDGAQPGLYSAALMRHGRTVIDILRAKGLFAPAELRLGRTVIGLRLKGAIGFSIDLTEAFDRGGSGDVEIAAQAALGASFTLNFEQVFPETRQFQFLAGPLQHDPFSGQTNVTTGLVLGIVGADLSIPKPDFDVLASELIRLFLLTTPDELLAEQIALELLERGDLKEGLHLVHGELIRVAPE